MRMINIAFIFLVSGIAHAQIKHFTPVDFSVFDSLTRKSVSIGDTKDTLLKNLGQPSSIETKPKYNLVNYYYEYALFSINTKTGKIHGIELSSPQFIEGYNTKTRIKKEIRFETFHGFFIGQSHSVLANTFGRYKKDKSIAFSDLPTAFNLDIIKPFTLSFSVEFNDLEQALVIRIYEGNPK